MAGLFFLVAGALSGVIWPSIQGGLDALAHAVSTSGALGQFVYGTLNRALIPVGLHHVLNSYFWFGMGTCQEILVSGAQAAGQAKPALEKLCGSSSSENPCCGSRAYFCVQKCGNA